MEHVLILFIIAHAESFTATFSSLEKCEMAAETFITRVIDHENAQPCHHRFSSETCSTKGNHLGELMPWVCVPR